MHNARSTFGYEIMILCFMFIQCYCDFADTQTPYSCTGQFQTDFSELCRRVEPPFVYTPAVVIRPHRPRSPTPLHVIEEKTTKTGKSKKEEKNQPAVEHEKTESPVSLEKGGCTLYLQYWTKGHVLIRILHM